MVNDKDDDDDDILDGVTTKKEIEIEKNSDSPTNENPPKSNEPKTDAQKDLKPSENEDPFYFVLA
jgi:hypothetical protein